MSRPPAHPGATARSALEFWISNLVIIVSTVLGVYLAAQAGFRTALEFEIARTEREGYFMRRALLDELKDNLTASTEYSDFIINRDGWRGRGNSPKLQDYVWQTMQQNTLTFQLPAEVLTGIRRYYNTFELLGKSFEIGQGTAIDAAKALAEEVRKAQETTVPALERNIAELREKLNARGFKVD